MSSSECGDGGAMPTIIIPNDWIEGGEPEPPQWPDYVQCSCSGQRELLIRTPIIGDGPAVEVECPKCGAIRIIAGGGD